ncbi:hypothetical protein [Sphingomonas quercus]|uniref:Uncharacterized protein n=1 Tax=Sphingomonas quercus TaxID=2842451 RepID=A0ABS6BGY5_9SPHN|nr:hypothetical protein [Sphingomonas quercus]MBU3077564.1 hypothetical protein [Sphingomonas quercus]
MTRYVRDYIELSDHVSLDEMIATLSALRETLPPGADAELRMRGDDVFGRRFSVSYMRPLNAEEAAVDARYTRVARPTRPVIAEIGTFERIEGETSLAA